MPGASLTTECAAPKPERETTPRTITFQLQELPETGDLAMLRPKDNHTRETKRLDGRWLFRFDPDDVGLDERWQSQPLANARQMAVPASYNDIFTSKAERDHVGPVWYQRTVVVPRGWTDQRIALYFESVTHGATVFVDDDEVATHQGGYLPFDVDITNRVTAGATVRLTVRVDNILTWQTIPPGVVETTKAGQRWQRYFHDFFNYAGIQRSVWLHARPQHAIADIAVVTDLDGSTGTVDYRVAVAGAEGADSAGAEVHVVLRDAAGVVVAEASGVHGRLSVPEVETWGVGRGYLYQLTAQLSGGGDVIDDYQLAVGVRTVEIQGTKILLNGEPVHLRGFGMHEDHVTIGKGHNDAMWLRDFSCLEWIGANSLRTAHYPYSEDVLDMADRAGILVIDETAAVGMNTAIAFGGARGRFETFSPDTINDETQQVHANHIRDLIDRDKNHPSVIMWSIANEPQSDSQAAEDYFAPLIQVARDADPQGRPVGFANVMLVPHGRCRVTPMCDYVMLNRYWGWYTQTGDLESAVLAAREELARWAGDGKPLIMSEYGADTQPGLHRLPADPWSEDYQVEYLNAMHAVFDEVDAVVGEHIWNFADFITTSGIMRVGGNKKGVFTRDRQPKHAAHVVRRRWQGAALDES